MINVRMEVHEEFVLPTIESLAVQGNTSSQDPMSLQTLTHCSVFLCAYSSYMFSDLTTVPHKIRLIY
jgi:hypothetical protein